MSTAFLKAAESEVRAQPRGLDAFHKTGIPRAGGMPVVVGAGDSFAAALAAFYASDGRCLAVDPYALASYPGIARGRDVFFVSVSGRTVSNVRAAESVRNVARSTTAITAANGSPLAEAARKTIILPVSPKPRFPGLLTFTLSLLAALEVSGVTIDCDFADTLKSAEESARFAFGRGTTYFLGNSAAHAASVYAAAKVHEILGEKAQAEALEEFSHVQVLALRKADAVNIFADLDPLGAGGKLADALRGRGFASNLVPAMGSAGIAQLFHSVFASQLAVLARARSMRVKRPMFLSAERQLGVSDSMIY
jgi:D-arabinose 5-phosphate isomerase GutQ